MPCIVNPQINQIIELTQGDVLESKPQCLVDELSIGVYSMSPVIEDLKRLSTLSFKEKFGRRPPSLRAGELCKLKFDAESECSLEWLFFLGIPKFGEYKYRTASENALSRCYFNALETLCEMSIRRVGFLLPNLEGKKGFPLNTAANIICATVRQFLETYGTRHFEKISLYVNGLRTSMDFLSYSSRKEEYQTTNQLFQDYQQIFKMYFPDNAQDENKVSLSTFTRYSGGNTTSGEGSPFIKTIGGDSESIDMIDFESPSVDSHERKRGVLRMSNCETQAERRDVYIRYMRDAQKMNFSDLENLKFCFVADVKDRFERKLLVFYAASFPTNVDETRLLHFLLYSLDSDIRSPYTLLYVHSSSMNCTPSFNFLTELYELFNARYENVLSQLIILFPTLLLKATLSLSYFVSMKIYYAVQYCDSIMDLNKYIEVARLSLPQFVLDEDKVAGNSFRLGILGF